MERPACLEFFSGLGGLGLAVKDRFRVAAAYDIDGDVEATHRLNHPHPLVRRGVESLDAAEIDRHDAVAWLLSPPCQPFTRRGKQRDLDDPRCAGLLKLIELLPRCRPKAILLENVPGFHGSRAHARLRSALEELGHEVRDVEACPSEQGAPVRRRRHFVLSCREGLAEGLAPGATLATDLDVHLDPAPAEDLTVPDELRRRFDDELPGREGRLSLHQWRERRCVARPLRARYGRSASPRSLAR
ncbi:MAG: DNA cytosine methyltransferase [Acidobacteriota bacterium]